MLRLAYYALWLGFFTCVATPSSAQPRRSKLSSSMVASHPSHKQLPASRSQCGNVQIVNEELLVNQVNRGIKNVAFYLYTGRGGTEVEVPANPGKTVTLVCNNGRFDPRFVVLQVGDTLKTV